MIETRSTIKRVEFAGLRYSDALHNFLSTQLRQAVREWVRAMVREIPTYSGMSRGSLLPIGKLPRMQNVRGITRDIHPVINYAKRDRRDGIPGTISDPIAEGSRLSFASLEYKKTNYEFFWATEVPQFVTNELTQGLGNPPLHKQTPWASLAVGANAFYGYLIPKIKRDRPNILQYFKVKVVKS